MWGGEARGAPGAAAARRALPWVAPLRPVPMEQTSALPPGVLDGRGGKKFHVRFVRPELSGGRLSPSVVPCGSGLAPWHPFATERGSGFLRTVSNSFSCCTAFFPALSVATRSPNSKPGFHSLLYCRPCFHSRCILYMKKGGDLMEKVQLILIQRFLACLKYFLLHVQFLRYSF